MLRFSFALSWLVVALLTVSTTHAQEVVSPDFANQVGPALPSNQQLLGQINDALPSTDLSAVTDETANSIGTAQNLSNRLTQALNIAPDDASRSRLESVLVHTQAALNSLQLVQTDTSLDAARGRLDQARGEVQEGLDELQPFVMSLIASGAVAGK
jgi:hypothetical protein